MKRLILSLAVAASLAACATRPASNIPVPVPCYTEEVPEPDFAFDNLPKGSGIWTQVTTLLADREQRIAYERELKAANRVCAFSPTGAASALASASR